jgi:hypothetical protein
MTAQKILRGYRARIATRNGGLTEHPPMIEIPEYKNILYPSDSHL